MCSADSTVTCQDTIFKIMKFPSFRHCFITLSTSWWEKETFGMNENSLILNILHVWPPGCYRNGQNIKKLFEPSDLAIELAARHCCLKSRVSKVYIRPNPLCQMPQLGVARVFDDGPAKGKGERGRLSKTIVTLSLHHPHHTLGHMWSHGVQESRNVVDTVGRRCQQEFICFYC